MRGDSITTALFLGRFQPFHLGHLNDVKLALSECDKLIIAIGSSQESGTIQNPFSFLEREKMIKLTLESEKISGCIVKPIEDINDDSMYVKHVEKRIPGFDKVYTGSKNTQRLFESAGYDVVFVKLFQDIQATFVRECMSKGGGWGLLVPQPVHDYILDIDGENRVKNLYRDFVFT